MLENLFLCIAIICVVAGIAICIQDKLERDLGDTLNYKNNEDNVYSPSPPNKNNCNSKDGSSNTVTGDNSNEVNNIGDTPHKLPSNGKLDEYTSEEKHEDQLGKPDNKENLPSLKDPEPRTHTQRKETISTKCEEAISKNKIESENFLYLAGEIKDPFPLPRSEKITCPKCGRELNPSNKCSFFDYLMECPGCGNIFSKNYKEGNHSPSKKNISSKEDKVESNIQKRCSVKICCDKLDPPLWIQYCPQCGEAMDDYPHNHCPMCGHPLGQSKTIPDTGLDINNIFNEIIRLHKEQGLLDYEKLICLCVARRGLPYKLGKEVREPGAADILLRMAFLNRLMIDCLYYVISPSKLYSQKYGVPIEDLFQEGSLFMIELLDKLSRSDEFLPKSKKKNDEMADVIKHILSNQIRSRLKTMARRNKKGFGRSWKIYELREDYYDKIYEIIRDTGEYPTLDGLWEKIDIYGWDSTRRQIERYLSYPPYRFIPLDNIELVSSYNTENINTEIIIKNVMRYLTDREQKVLSMRFGLNDGIPADLETVGIHYNVTRERIRQIEGKALSKLRHWGKRELRNEAYILEDEIIRKQKEELKRWGEKVNKEPVKKSL